MLCVFMIVLYNFKNFLFKVPVYMLLEIVPVLLHYVTLPVFFVFVLLLRIVVSSC